MTDRRIDPVGLACIVAGMTPEQREAAADDVRAELARRAAEAPSRRELAVEALDRPADVDALVALAELIAESGNDDGRRELILATIDRVSGTFAVVHDALRQPFPG